MSIATQYFEQHVADATRSLKCVVILMSLYRWSRMTSTQFQLFDGGMDRGYYFRMLSWFTQSIFVFPSQEDGAMQSCIYSCSPLNVVDLIVDIMFIIDILINFRCEIRHMKEMLMKQLWHESSHVFILSGQHTWTQMTRWLVTQYVLPSITLKAGSS